MKSLQPIRELLAWLPLAWLPLAWLPPVCVFLALVLPGCDHGGTSPSGSEDEQPADGANLDSDIANPGDTAVDANDDAGEITLLDEAPWSDERIAEEVAACEAWHAAQPPPDVEVDQVVDCSSGDCSVDVLLPNADRVPVEVTVTWDKLPVPKIDRCFFNSDCQAGRVRFLDKEGVIQGQTPASNGVDTTHTVHLPRGVPLTAIFGGKPSSTTLPAGELILATDFFVEEGTSLNYQIDGGDVVRLSGRLLVDGVAPDERADYENWGLVLRPQGQALGSVIGLDYPITGPDFSLDVFSGQYDVYAGMGRQVDAFDLTRIRPEYEQWSSSTRIPWGYRKVASVDLSTDVALDLDEQTVLLHGEVTTGSPTLELKYKQTHRPVLERGTELVLPADSGAYEVELWKGTYWLDFRGVTPFAMEIEADVRFDVTGEFKLPLHVETWSEKPWWDLSRAENGIGGLRVPDAINNGFVEPSEVVLNQGESTVGLHWTTFGANGVLIEEIRQDTEQVNFELELPVPLPFSSELRLLEWTRLLQPWIHPAQGARLEEPSRTSVLPGVYAVDVFAVDTAPYRMPCVPVFGTSELRLSAPPFWLNLQAVSPDGRALSSVEFAVTQLDAGQPEWNMYTRTIHTVADASTSRVQLGPGLYRVAARVDSPDLPYHWAIGSQVVEVK